MPAGENLTDGRMLTAEEQANLATMRRWNDLYDGEDMAAFVTETYHPDMKVTLLDGTTFDGAVVSLDSPQVFIEVETLIKSECPGRRVVIEREIAAGNTVIIEAVLLDDARPDFRLAWCGFYTFEDGLIISDHS